MVLVKLKFGGVTHLADANTSNSFEKFQETCCRLFSLESESTVRFIWGE